MKRLLGLTVLCAFGLDGPGPLWADDIVYSRSLVCMRTASPPQIDGRLDEKAWQEAPPATDFISLGSRDMPEVKPTYPVEDQTVVRALHDDKQLYVGIECKAPPKDKFRMIRGGRDVNFLSAESVEIVVSPRPTTGRACQFAVNPENAQLDAELREDSFDTTWNAPWQSAVSGGPGMWRAELAIPFRSLGADLAATGCVWSVNMRRNHSGWHQMSVWQNPVEPRLSDVRTYGHLVFVDPADRCALTSLSCPLLAPWGENTIRLGFRGAGNVTLIGNGNIRKEMTARPGESVSVAVPIVGSGCTPFRLDGPARKCSFAVWSRDLLSLRLETILVAKPDGTAGGTLRIAARPDFLKALVIKARLVDGKGGASESTIRSPQSPTVGVLLPLADLSAGVCRFQVEAGRNGKTCAALEKKLDLVNGDFPF